MPTDIPEDLWTIVLWDLSGTEPQRMAHLVTPLPGLVITPDGYVDGPAEALEGVRFVDGWAVYELEDLPERRSEERLRAALRPGSTVL